MLANILSIDWDYFFPTTDNYDWGANEEYTLYLETIWVTRCADKNYVTKKNVLDEYKPKVPKDFWSIVLNDPSIYVGESH